MPAGRNPHLAQKRIRLVELRSNKIKQKFSSLLPKRDLMANALGKISKIYPAQK